MTKSRASKQKQVEERDDSLCSESQDVTSTLLKLVVKVTEVLTKNSELQEEIRDLRQCNRDLLLRVENLEGKSGEWTSREAHQTAPLSDVMALTATVADELQSRKDKDQNLVIYGLREITEDRDSTVNEESEKEAVCELLTHLQVPSPNISTVFRMGRRSPGRPRPVKVFCGNPETREVALRNSRKLKDLPSSHKCFIRADLTKLQRDQAYQQRRDSRQQASGGPTPSTHRSSGEPKEAMISSALYFTPATRSVSFIGPTG